MATVGIWKIDCRLNSVIEYISREEKTNLEDFNKYHNLLDYKNENENDEKKLLITGINCNKDKALKEMNYTKKRFHKKGGILGFHSYQSFKHGEVTPEIAHEVGLQLANEMWGDRFQVLVATHMDKNHIHNHFLINSVSFVDGKRYYDNHSSYAELRRLNDLICKEHNLSYLEEKETKAGLNYVNFQKKNANTINSYQRTKRDLDLAISSSSTFNEFKNTMINLGYEVNIRYERISVRYKDDKRNIRIERIFGKDYSLENVKKQIQGLYIPENRVHYKKYKSNDTLKDLLKVSNRSLYGLYIHYLKLLKVYPEYIKKYKPSSSMKEDVNKMEDISREANLLASNNINTEEQFYEFYDYKVNELVELKDLKEKLQKKYRMNKDENIKYQIESINIELPMIKEEIKQLNKIRIRKENIKDSIDEINIDKEVIRDEYIK